MLYKIDNHSENVLNMDNEAIFEHIINKYGLRDDMKDPSDDDVLELMKEVTRDPKKLHEIALETKVPIIDILRVIVTMMPEIVDKRFLTRMRKLYNSRS